MGILGDVLLNTAILFFMGIFSRKAQTCVVLIDIGSSSIGGSYTVFEDGKPPTMYFNIRLPIDTREGESIDTAMLRTLEDVHSYLIRDGAPSVRREIGSGHIDHVLVSVAAPWQETKVKTQTISPGKPFTFTQNMVSDIVSGIEIPKDKVGSGESIIATILNGYETNQPFDKVVTRVDLVILSSTLVKEVTEKIKKSIRASYHTSEITFTAFAPVSYAVLRDLYPHEKDFLVVDVSGEGTDVAFVKRGLLIDVGSLRQGINALLDSGRRAGLRSLAEEKQTARMPMTQPGYIHPERNTAFGVQAESAEREWLQTMSALLRAFANRHALPRTLFLLADDEVRSYLKRTLNSGALHTLWLSDSPLSIIPITPAQFLPYVQTRGLAQGDIFLSILALYYRKQSKSKV